MKTQIWPWCIVVTDKIKKKTSLVSTGLVVIIILITITSSSSSSPEKFPDESISNELAIIRDF